MRPITINDVYEIDVFKFRFNREPKIWTIEKVNELYNRAVERASQRRLLYTEVYAEVTTKIPKDEYGNHLIYVRDEDGDTIRYQFRYNEDWKAYGVSHNVLRPNGNSIKNKRDILIESLTITDLQFKLGAKYEHASRMSTNHPNIIFRILFKMIVEKLRAHYKKSDKRPKGIITVNVGADSYYLKCKDSYSSYYEFEFVGLVGEEDSFNFTD